MTEHEQSEVERRKLEVETAKLEQDMEWQRESREAEREAMRLKNDSLRYELESKRVASVKAALELETYELGLRRQRADWTFQNTYHFIGPVNASQAQSCIDELNEFHHLDPHCDITIYFNSPGGDVIAGYALFDYIRFMRGQGHRVTIIALGYAASMAGILLQAGDVRVMAKGSWLLIHEVAFGAAGKIGEVEDMYEFGRRLKEQAANILVERSGGKLTREILDRNWTRKDWWLSAEEALELGLVDEVR